MSESATSVLSVLLTGFVTQAVAYFAVVGLLFAIFWRWGKERFRSARISVVDRFDRAQLRRELKYTVVTLVVGMSSAGSVMALHAKGLTRLVDGPTPVWVTLAWAAGFLFLNDLWFYGWHRLLHHPKLFRHVHAVHHKSVDVNPFTSYSFHAVEAFVLGAWIVPASLLVPLPMSALGLMQIAGLANNVMSHMGYELLPRWLLKVPLLKWMNTATFHSLHHTRLRGNFGLHSRIWDRLFGTEVPEYERDFLARTPRTRGVSINQPNG